MNIIDILIDRANEQSDAIALIEHKNKRVIKFSFSQLNETSAKIAQLLRNKGVQKNDAVLFFQPMSIELYAGLCACFRIGATAMFIDPGMGREHIEGCCEIYPPKAFIGTNKAQFFRFISATIRNIPIHINTGTWLPFTTTLTTADSLTSLRELVYNEGALLTFTSGSTGKPKAALRTHAFLLAQHKQLLMTLNSNPGDIEITSLPIFALSNIASGVTTVIPEGDLRRPGSIDPEPIARQIETYHPRRLSAPPALLSQLLTYYEQKHRIISNPLAIFTGGAPVFPQLMKRLESINTGGTITAVYGSTEAEPIAHINYQDIDEDDIQLMTSGAGLLAGLPIENIELLIFDTRYNNSTNLTQETFESYCLFQGEIGEIIVSGDHVLKGYYQGIGDEETKIHVGNKVWHRTGDAGYLDKQSRLWLLGRCIAKIKDANGSLYPFTVECAALNNPLIIRAAFLQYQGQRVLIIEANHQFDADDIKTLEDSLGWAKINKTLQIDRIPVDLRHNSKIDYPTIKKWLGNL